SWHAHEMIYGFAAAGLTGFMLTAVPNWTGAPPLRGAPLAGLALLWLVGRLAMTLPAVFPPQVGAGLDPAFIPALGLAISVPLVDRSAIAAMALLIIVEAVTEMSVMTGVVALVAAVLNAIRLAGWRGERTLRSPILWILHLGYLWLIVGLALKAAAALS